MKSAKCTDQEILSAYAQTGNIWKAALILGMHGQTLHRRLVKLNVQLNNRPFTDDELSIIRDAYSTVQLRGDLGLQELARSMGRNHTSVCREAGRMGLTLKTRPLDASSKQKLHIGYRNMLETKGHPKGALGHRHSERSLARISAASIASWNKKTPSERSEHILRALKTKDANGGQNPGRGRGSWHSAWFEVGGKRHFFRSRWEMNYACWLEFQKTRLKEIADWHYEPDTFWFEKIKRGVRSYKPDFRITGLDGAIHYDEVKGWMDDESKTKLNRMRIYYPKVKVNLIDAAWFKSHANLARIVPGWQVAPPRKPASRSP